MRVKWLSLREPCHASSDRIAENLCAGRWLQGHQRLLGPRDKGMPWQWSAFGVDLFFTLSSFLITTLLLRESSVCGALDVTAFYLRRVLRILPLYFGFLLAATTLARSLVPDENLPLKYVVAFALLCGNWACVLWGYPHSVASPLWSVSIEEQFYLCWPLIMRRWVHRLTMVAVGLLLVSFVTRLCLVLHGAIHPQIWCNTLARLDPIACGALLAVRQDKREISLSPGIRVALLLGGCGVLTAAGHFGDVVGIKALITFPAVTAACVALLVAALSLFGVPSSHAPLARLMRAMAALLATIVVAASSYHWFERPFLRLKESFTHVRSRPV